LLVVGKGNNNFGNKKEKGENLCNFALIVGLQKSKSLFFFYETFCYLCTIKQKSVINEGLRSNRF
jgi:hypothetical protein